MKMLKIALYYLDVKESEKHHLDPIPSLGLVQRSVQSILG